jgi:hypothetical protein
VVWRILVFFFFRTRIIKYTRSFETAGTTHCCQKLTFFGGWGVNVTFGLPAMHLKNVQMYEIYFAVELIHICSQNPPWCMHVLQFLGMSVIFFVHY